MRKFRLIKHYPGSPNPGTIIHELENTDSYIIDLSNKLIYKKEVEDYPEFWEEVKEEMREYLIIDLKESVDPSTDFKDIFISKVKRVSDEMVFELGDRIVLEKYMSGRKFIQIDRIYVNEHNQLSFSTDQGDILPKTFVFGISDINCRRYNPILTTEDGVEKFEDDEVFWVEDYTKIDRKQFNFGVTIYFKVFNIKLNDHFNNYHFPFRVFFGKKENAERYLEDTFPMFSKRQILDALKYSQVSHCEGHFWFLRFKGKMNKYLNL